MPKTGNITNPGLASLAERLRQAQWRSTLFRAINCLVTGLLVALAVFCLLQLAHELLGTLAPSVTFADPFVPGWIADMQPPPFSQNLLLAAGAGIVVILITPVFAILRHPDIGFMARAADRRFGMQDCLSTALEIESDPARSHGVVVQALLQDAGSRSKAVDPRSLVPLRLHRQAVGVPVLLAGAALFTFAPPPPLVQDAYQALLPTTFKTPSLTQEQAETAANLRAVAAILKQDGEARADPAIQAIASAVNRLGKEVTRNSGMKGDTLSKELSRLLTLARNAYERVGEAKTPRNLSRLIADLGADAPNRPDKEYQDVPVNETTEEVWEPPLEDNPLGADGVGLLTTREYAGIDDFDNMVAPPTVLGDPRRDQPRGEGPAHAMAMDERTATMNAPGDDDYGPAGPNADGAIAGEMIGAGGGFGEGDYAGIGTEALFGPGEGPFDPFAVAGELVLENPGLGGGRRIRFNLPPQVELRVPEMNIPGAVGGWRTLAEGEVTRTDLPAPARDVVSRYFKTLRLGREN